MAAKQQLEVDGRTLTLTNLAKVLYPAAQFTKAHVIDYYARAAPWILPHLKDRPVTLKRLPNGIGGQTFYEKDAPRFTPDWVAIAPVPRRAGGPAIRYVLINDRPTLIWCANIASLELHPFLHRAPELNTPTSIVFDLDPGPKANIVTCARVAILLRDVLEKFGLKMFPKLSGSKGIQVYVPLNTPVSYDQTQPFARAIAELLSRQHPEMIIAEMAKDLRTGKVFIDWSQNSDFKTTVAVYSLRAKAGRPFVSLPLTWEEMDDIAKGKDPNRLCLAPDEALRRLDAIGDLFGPVLKLRQKIPASFEVPDQGSPPKTLKTHRAKRNFSKTAAAPLAVTTGKPGTRRFVVQKHAASHLHYDFRLEASEVLHSWAVPKGVPYALDERRLAMATEDHPIEYIDFEGVIPAGQYGGGTVMVWDTGTYEVLDGNFYKGKLHVRLKGRKLKGEWVLVKATGEDKKRWYLLKTGEAAKPPTAKRENASALTGRTMEQIAASKDAQWYSNRTEVPELDLDALPKADLGFIEPMQAAASGDLPEGAGWQYEIKFDGYRALAIKNKGEVRLLSRRNNVLNSRFAGIIDGLLPLEDGLILDGEVVALDEKGRPSFNLLQNYGKATYPIVYYVFDILAYRGRSLLGLSLSKRREILAVALTFAAEPIRLSATLHAEPATLIAAAAEQGLEGLVAKRGESVYEPGRRSGAWVKYRINKGQELVIGGYKPGKDGFDNLAVGYYADGALQFIAKIKNGFVPETKADLMKQFKGLETSECPFANLPEPRNARRGEALTAEAMKKYRWLRPELVAATEFADWTDANHLRHSRFIGMRDDKDPREVVREQTGATDGTNRDS